MAFWQKLANEDGWTAVVFGTDRIAVASVERRREERPRVRACDSFAREGDELEALKRLKNAKRLARQRCTTLLWHGQYQLLQVDAPDNARDLPHDELREAMRWRVKDMVDFPVEQAGIDVLDIPAPASRSPQLWVVVANRDALQARVRLFQDSRIPLTAIDIPELAQRNIAALFEEPNRGLAVVAFDSKGGRLTISYQGELFMVRHLDVGGPELAGAQAGALHERVLLDIQRSLDNFDRNYSAVPLNRLLVGPLPGGEKFVEYLAANLSLPVASANLADVLDIEATPALAEVSAQYDNWRALGAALRDQ
ncbi:MAG: agglutinin biogenesis protein MshI [Pseudomonadota bacterium]